MQSVRTERQKQPKFYHQKCVVATPLWFSTTAAGIKRHSLSSLQALYTNDLREAAENQSRGRSEHNMTEVAFLSTFSNLQDQDYCYYRTQVTT